jgi:hypothetical protein
VPPPQRFDRHGPGVVVRRDKAAILIMTPGIKISAIGGILML